MGKTLNAAMPYYFNDDDPSDSPTKDGKNWNACLEIEDGEYTLRLNGLIAESFGLTVISVDDIDTLYILLESKGNKVSTSLNDTNAAAIRCNNLVVNGNGELAAKATGTGGSGIAASSIKLQCPTELIVEGSDAATSVQVTCSEGKNAYKASPAGAGDEIEDYFSNGTRFGSENYVNFTPKENARLPVWVNGSRSRRSI